MSAKSGNAHPPVRRRRINWAPYLLILPSFLYLALFFAWPMAQGLILSVWDDEALLTLHSQASRDSAVTGHLPQNSQLSILGQQANLVQPGKTLGENALTETWFRIQAQDADGQPVEGWVSERRVRVRETDEAGNPVKGTIRIRLGQNTDPQTAIYAAPSDRSDVVAKLDPRTPVSIVEHKVLEVWYHVQGQDEKGQTVEGWAPSRFIQVFSNGERGRVDRGDTGQFTTKFIQKMVNDRFFRPAVTNTLLLMIIIIPTQFVLAVIMALVIQARLKGNAFFLYVFAIPLGVSDLAVGILWFSIFTQHGLLNSILQTLGVIDAPVTYLSAQTRHWIIIAVWLAEVWRATSLVMVIVVSGLQSISQEVLEAAELFGANLWQRVRYVILPLLRPSLQVALILRTILALQVFAVVIALSGGDVVTVLANETYRQYTQFRNPNVAAAYAAFILLLSMVSAVLYLRTLRSHQEIAG